MEKVVIAGSVSLQSKIFYWKKYFKNRNYEVLDFPTIIPKKYFLDNYPQIHKFFFENIIKTDILFIMNEDKKGIEGYIGAETFAEMCFGVAQNLVYNKNIEIILLKLPAKEVQSFEEINLWLELDWIKLYKGN